MISLKIEEVKAFMSELFTADMFDRFEVLDVEVKTLYTTKISGRVNRQWLDTDEAEGEYMVWSRLKPVVYDLIKGKKTPLLLMIHFSYKEEGGNRAGIRIHYAGNELRMITEYSMAGFSLDKSGEREWDDNCKNFLKKHQLIYLEENC